MATTLLMSGYDLRLVELPPGARVLTAPETVPPLTDFRRAVAEAMEQPLDGLPIMERVGPGARVAIVIDDFSLPVPPPQKDCRGEMLSVTVELLLRAGVRPNRISVTIANGLSRQWRPAELLEILGEQEVETIQCHDAEAPTQLHRLGDVDGIPVELNRVLTDSDLVIYLNVVSTPLHAGLFGVVTGLSGYRTARALQAPPLFEDEAPLSYGSRFHQLVEKVGARLLEQVPFFQVSAVLDNALVGSKLAALTVPDAMLQRPLQVWNAIPGPVRQRAARLLRGNFRPFAAVAGSPAEVAPRALDAFRLQHERGGDGGADVLLFGVPDVGPASFGTQQNPVLATSLALGWIAQLFNGRPLLRKGGVILFANPLTPQFDRAHAPHQEFYERVLRMEREPAAIHERFEAYFAGRPEFVSGYQRRFAFHGTHPLLAWTQCAPARRQAGRIIVAHGDPRACARLGFTPANDVTDALTKAREFLGATPEVTVLQLPPAFWVRTQPGA